MEAKKSEFGMYIIDSDYQIIYANRTTKNMYPNLKVGDICHKALSGFDAPCADCPIGKGSSLFYNSQQKGWIVTESEEMELPEYGICHNIQFQVKKQGVGKGVQSLFDRHIIEQLKTKEAEAVQLLAAINTTYDMVVSVNLTQNTYRLFEIDSFVTNGDSITGVFDEVIDVHCQKVVDKHKDMYYNTFSRQALLKAHSEGKKSVYLEYQQCDDDGVPHWLGTHTMFTENPYGSDVMEITISRNIDERIYKEEKNKAALEEALRLAEQANRAKSNFLSSMSHDIRTPMNAVVGFAYLALKEDDFSVVKNNYLPKIRTAGELLLMLINDILEMSRIESGKIELKEYPYDLGEISKDIAQVVSSLAQEKRINLKTVSTVTDYYVYCDKLRIHQIITNLLSNAVKFTPEQGTVSVSIKQDSCDEQGYAEYEFVVSDTGIGMSEEFLNSVFDPFEREKTSTVTRVEGTGLGLAIVKNLVDIMGGTITIDSQINKGTIVKIKLKLKIASSDVVRKVSINEENARKMDIEKAKSFFKGKRLLLVEDNELNLMIAETLLVEAGFIVDTAEDGTYAVDMVKNAPADDYYDVILMDIQMPIMNGYEATRIIRAMDSDRKNVKIIALTANAFESDVGDAASAGMNAHVSKPVNVEELYGVLFRELNKE